MADGKQTTALPEPQPAPPAPENASGLHDKRVRPEGVVPKQAQSYVVAGLAVLILMAVMFSKSRERWTANVVYGFRDEVPNAMLLTNPLGMVISYVHEDQAFGS